MLSSKTMGVTNTAPLSRIDHDQISGPHDFLKFKADTTHETFGVSNVKGPHTSTLPVIQLVPVIYGTHCTGNSAPHVFICTVSSTDKQLLTQQGFSHNKVV